MESCRYLKRTYSLLESRRFSSGWHPLSNCRRVSVQQVEVTGEGEED